MGWFHRERSDSETSDVEIPTGGGRRPTPPHGGPSDLTSTTLSDADESKRQSRGSYSRRKYGSSTASLDDIDVDAGARTMDTTTMYASRILLSALVDTEIGYRVYENMRTIAARFTVWRGHDPG